MVNKLDEENITDSDFSVMFENLPPDCTKADIRNIIKRSLKDSEKDNLVYINFCYEVSKINKLKSRQETIVRLLNKLKAYRKRKL